MGMYVAGANVCSWSMYATGVCVTSSKTGQVGWICRVYSVVQISFMSGYGIHASPFDCESNGEKKGISIEVLRGLWHEWSGLEVIVVRYHDCMKGG